MTSGPTVNGDIFGSRLHHSMGVTGAHILTRLPGVILCALALQFVFDGLEKNGF
jgi:multiple antibiotic resistance protein